VESPLCRPDTRLIETFGWTPAGFRRLDAHLARARASARALGFAWDDAAVGRALASVGGPDPLRVRLTIGRAGDAEVTTGAMGAAPAKWRVALAGERLASADPLLRHKTTERALYDRARAALPDGIDEWVFLNERGEICEGSITNLFVEDDRVLLTPALACGCLPGILRAELIADGSAREAVLTTSDLADAAFYLGNSLRGLIPCTLVS